MYKPVFQIKKVTMVITSVDQFHKLSLAKLMSKECAFWHTLSWNILMYLCI